MYDLDFVYLDFELPNLVWTVEIIFLSLVWLSSMLGKKLPTTDLSICDPGFLVSQKKILLNFIHLKTRNLNKRKQRGSDSQTEKKSLAKR